MPITEHQLLPQDEWRAAGGGRSGMLGRALNVDRDGNVKHGNGKREKEFHDWHSLSDCGRRKLL